MNRGERIAAIIRRKYFSEKEDADEQKERKEYVANPKDVDDNNPMGMPTHVPASGDDNDPTGTGHGGAL
jgi:hypothetical protein